MDTDLINILKSFIHLAVTTLWLVTCRYEAPHDMSLGLGTKVQEGPEFLRVSVGLTLPARATRPIGWVPVRQNLSDTCPGASVLKSVSGDFIMKQGWNLWGKNKGKISSLKESHTLRYKTETKLKILKEHVPF